MKLFCLRILFVSLFISSSYYGSALETENAEKEIIQSLFSSDTDANNRALAYITQNTPGSLIPHLKNMILSSVDFEKKIISEKEELQLLMDDFRARQANVLFSTAHLLWKSGRKLSDICDLFLLRKNRCNYKRIKNPFPPRENSSDQK